jgi:hypothetical protein
MMVWQLTSTMVRGCSPGCLPSLYRPSHDQLAWQMVPEVPCYGRLARWPMRGLARGTTPIATQTSQAAPGTALQLSLLCGCGTVVLPAPGPSGWARQTSQLHGNRVTW